LRHRLEADAQDGRARIAVAMNSAAPARATFDRIRGPSSLGYPDGAGFAWLPASSATTRLADLGLPATFVAILTLSSKIVA
jgi:hypothetical protein